METSKEEKNIQTDVTFLRKEYHKQCIIASFNINSLQSKFEEVKEWLDEQVFDILTVQEAKIDRTFPNSQFYIDGYKLFRKDRTKGGGGIAVYVRDSIAALRKRKSGESLAHILLDVLLNNRRFAIVRAYKSPSVDNATFTRELSAVLDEAISFSNTLLCTGDLNCDILHPLDNNKEGRCLLDICDVCDLDSIINTPTRISKTKKSCLDVDLTTALQPS